MSAVTRPEDWLADLADFRGEWQGAAHGAALCVIANRIEHPGGGPRLHKHPYPEVFVIRRGTALFSVGGQRIEAAEGSIVVAPANTPHKFENVGPGPLETIDIHQNGSFVTEWLE